MALKEFTPLEIFEYTWQRWWLVVALILAGGLFGYAFQFVQPPIYEAAASFVVTINFTETGNLTQFEEDHAVGAAGNLMLSIVVIDQVLLDVQALGLDLDEADLREIFFLERRQERWDLIVRHRDPETAAALANIWAERSHEALVQAYGHARQAHYYQYYLNGLKGCLGAETFAPQAPTLCSELTIAEIQERIEVLEPMFDHEMWASRAIIPSLLIELSQKASVPEAPVSHRTNLLVLSGSLLGFIAGVFLSQPRKR
jgi:hypothetical protein